MEDPQNLVSGAIELIVAVSVAALVWITVLAGLYQLVRERLRQFHLATQRPAQDRYSHSRDAGPQIAHHPPAVGR